MLLFGHPTAGFRDDTLTPEAFLRAARNFIVSGDFYRSRPGFINRRKVAPSPASATWMERLPLDETDGTRHALLHYGADIVTDADAPVTQEAAVYNPYAATTNGLPSWIHMKGRLVWVANGAVQRVMIHDGSSFYVRAPLTDPAKPTVAVNSSGHSVTAGTWFVRIRWYDSVTQTYSGPSERTVSPATATAVVTGAAERIQVTMPTAPSRATHWQVQLARTTDTPGTYEIHYLPKDAAGAAAAGVDSVGRMPVSTTTAYFIADPASGARFPFRTQGVLTLYQHSNLPAADYVTEWRGRAFYAAKNDTWLVWSESDNPEHCYHDTSTLGEGLNATGGENMVSGVVSPFTGLAANEANLLIFTRNGVILGEGSWAVTGDTRHGQLTALVQNSTGAVSPSTFVKDQQVFFASQEGPKMYAGGVVPDVMDSAAIRHVWATRDPQYDHRIKVGYDPRHDVVMFAFVSKNAPIAGVCDVVLAWYVGRQLWCPPWDVALCSMTLHRLTTDGGVDRGTRLMWAGPYGTVGEFGAGYGDGWDGSDADADEFNDSSNTNTSVDKTGAGWTADEHVGRSVVLVDVTTGDVKVRWIKDNDADTLTWDGNAADTGGGWVVAIGGIAPILHRALLANGEEVHVSNVRILLDDSLSRLA